LCRGGGSRLISDETYALMTEEDPLPPAAALDPTAVSISTMSKT
jgi:aspartate/methionine/tyrosine aminotransferase